MPRHNVEHTLQNQWTIFNKIVKRETSIEWVLLCTRAGGALEKNCNRQSKPEARAQVPKLHEFAQRLARAYDENDPTFGRDRPPFVA